MKVMVWANGNSMCSLWKFCVLFCNFSETVLKFKSFINDEIIGL